MKVNYTKCCYCRRNFDDSKDNLRKTKDHFIPISRGGYNGENILHSCNECNSWKGDKMPEDWLNIILRFQKRNKLCGSYNSFDYCNIVGSIRYWIKQLKGKKIGEYRF